jgi:multisubunit Na+/H+ antiporter MnhE subunit
MARSTYIVIATVVRAATLFAIWLAIDDNVSQPELFTGIAVALLATVIVTVAGRVRTAHPRMTPSMLRYGYRPLLLLVADSVRVTWVLAKAIVLSRPTGSRFRAVRYRATSDSDADTGRRVLTTWGASLAPNRYAIGVDDDDELLLVHQLGEARGPLDPLELG